jgi:hypothetical protein
MKKYFTSILFIISSLIYSQNLFAKDQCNIDQQVNLNIFKKNDYKFYNYICESSEGSYLKGYVGDQEKKYLLVIILILQLRKVLNF